MQKVIISVIGQDRPGIIAAITRLLFEQDCNLENVSQTILQAEFAGTFVASVPPAMAIDKLSQMLNARLLNMDLTAHVKTIDPDRSDTPAVDGDPFVITTMGPDQKGLVAGITEVMAKHGVNVTDLQAVFKGGEKPEANIMIYEVVVSRETDQALLDRDLRARAAELNLEINIQHRKIFEMMNRI